MAIGMARSGAHLCLPLACLAFALGLGLRTAAAEELPAPSGPPPLSPACDVPANDIAAPAPLPNVAALLEKKRTIHILAIGSSSTIGVGASSGLKSYPTQLGDILEKALKDVDVEIANYAFSPDEVEVEAGGTVTFTNSDDTTHTATAESDAPASFDTGELGQGDSKTITFDEPGVYDYECSIHEYMKGTVRVIG